MTRTKYDFDLPSHQANQLRDMHKCAERYEACFGFPLVVRMRQLLVQYPEVSNGNWLSWEGARYTNVTNSSGLRRWISALSI